MEGVYVEPVTDLSGQTGEPLVHARHLDRDLGEVDRPAGEEIGEEGERVEVARERELLFTLEGAEDRTEGEHVLAHPRHRTIPLGGEPAHDVRLHLCAEAELKAPAYCSARSQAICAVTIGLRGNATATEVPTSRPPPAASVATAQRGTGCGPPR